MRFVIEQSFACDPNKVLQALTSPRYLAMMGELPDLSVPVLEDQVRTPTEVRQRLRFQFAGSLPSMVTKVVDPKRLSWHEHTVVNMLDRTATFTMVPIHYQSFFTCKGMWSLRLDNNPSRTIRTINGDLKVSSPVPFVNGRVEKAIISGLRERLAEEPTVLLRWLQNPV